MTTAGESVFAFTNDVPELDGLITGTGDDLTVVGREGDGKNIFGVTNETVGSNTSVYIPETESLIPRRGKDVMTVRRDDNVGDKVVVTFKSTTGNSVVNFITDNIPNKNSLIC